MPTRNNPRRELKDLARLASPASAAPAAPILPPGRPVPPLPPVLPVSKQGASDSQQVHRSTGSHVTVPPSVTSVLAQRPSPSGAAVGSAITSVRSGSWPVAFFKAAFGEGSNWRGVWAILAGGTLAAAMVGGVMLGQVLTSRFSGETGSEAEANGTAPETEPRATAPLKPMAPATGGDTPATSTPTALPVAADSSALVTTLRAPPAAHHLEFRQPPRPAMVNAPPPISPVPKAVPPKAPAAHRNAQDALEELIRKAASGS